MHDLCPLCAISVSVTVSKASKCGDEEASWWLRALTALTEDQGLDCSTSFWGRMHSAGLCGFLHTHDTYMLTQAHTTHKAF